ncbi:putative glycogenin protein [Eutypa lata UCREL1]|uniref:glycogenin glucosyltransferase n=1 Tax=Eutypa lata (strain UCR-EL1) TaxID=1287681 RepID=M7SM26_EUTLA|nr:putative glycogenin protein [Eutypa lata UCREL1]
MAAQSGVVTLEDVYATLLLSDTYLPGALVLAHSLRDAGTTKKLAVLVTLDSVSAGVITQLMPANLQLMNRTDLHSAFTKINLWKQTQFRKIVYIDSDVVAYRAPDELFDIPHPFSAAPDIGWPDLFNTGVMVISPNMGDFYAMLAMAERGISFDGADQGLINMHFRNNYNRISFTYNVTPSAHYQYIPAYRHFQSMTTIKTMGNNTILPLRPIMNMSMCSRITNMLLAVIRIILMTTNTIITRTNHPVVTNLKGPEAEAREEQVPQPPPGAPPPQPEPEQNQPPFQPSFASWDAQRHPPPSDSKPEAENFPATVYEMSKDSAPFVPPERYPSPPKNMWYNVPKEPPAPATAKPKPIFPWEDHRSQPTRVFPDDTPEEQKPGFGNLSLSTGETWDPTTAAAPGASTESSVITAETGSEDQKSEPITPLTPTIRITSSDPWTAFTRSNAWDEIPEIERYVDSMQQKHRRTRSLKSPGVIGLPSPGEGVDEAAWRRRGSKLTDFPSKDERPSLPVTPAPIRRPKFWGGGGGGGAGGHSLGGYDGDEDDSPLLPAAEGVPEQTHWDPVAQLQKLARQHSDALLQKLGGDGGGGGGGGGGSGGGSNISSSDLPLRPLPFGSEALVSPTYVAPTASTRANISSSSSSIVSPQPVKGTAPAAAIPGLAAPAFLKGEVDLDATPLAIPRKPTTSGDDDNGPRQALEAVFFTDPGPALKKGEIVQTGTEGTAPPSSSSSTLSPGNEN